MLTIFTAPRAFDNQFGLIQRNAILSWLRLHPQCEIILFGEEEGIAEMAGEFGILHIPDIKKNESGTPLVDDLFERAKKTAKNNILAYVNADIILIGDFMEAVEKLKGGNFLMIGRRWDLDLKEPINFQDRDWEGELKNKITKEGKLHGQAGSDYFVFQKNLWKILIK